MKNNKVLWFVGAAIILVLALFIVPKLKGTANTYNGSLDCLLPNLQLALHWHPTLKILVDGQSESIPSNLGLIGDCHFPLHTHDSSGAIHVEAQVVRDYTLGEFMEVWGQPLQRDGYTLEMTVDGQPNTDFGNLVLKDKQEIVLNYSKITSN